MHAAAPITPNSALEANLRSSFVDGELTITLAMPTKGQPSTNALRCVAEITQRTSYIVERVNDEIMKPALQNIANLHTRFMPELDRIQEYKRLSALVLRANEYLKNLTRDTASDTQITAEYEDVHLFGAYDPEEVDVLIRHLQEHEAPVPDGTLATKLASLASAEDKPPQPEYLRFAIQNDRPDDILNLELMEAYYAAVRKEFSTLLEADFAACAGYFPFDQRPTIDPGDRTVLRKPNVVDYLLARSIMLEVDIPTMFNRPLSPSLLAEVLGHKMVLPRSPVGEEQSAYHHTLNDGPAWRAALRATAAEAVSEQRALINDELMMEGEDVGPLDNRIIMAAIIRTLRSNPRFRANIRMIPRHYLDLILQRSANQYLG